MHRVRFCGGKLLIDGKGHLLLSGEFHYWRHNPAYWDAIFDRIRAIGIDIVSTFVPFNFHELKPGVFDFEGRTMPERDLAGFLDRAAHHGVRVILRPAPSEAGEWPNAGLPSRLLGLHRLHATYVRAVKKYYDAVLPVIALRQATRGGPVVMVQVDNEPHADFVGGYRDLVGPRGLFNRWLRSRYGSVAKLNRGWRSDYRSFADAAPFIEEPIVDQDAPELHRLMPDAVLDRRFADTQRFVAWYAAEIVRWTAAYFRCAGIDVPLSANIWHPSALDLAALRETVDLAGVDLYPAQYFGLDRPGVSSRAAASGIESMQESLKLAQARFGAAHIPECSAGIPSAWVGEYGDHGGNHPLYALLTFLMHGAKAVSLYMLVGRDNWHGSPIDPFGNTTPRYGKFDEFVRVFRRVDPPALHGLADISLYSSRDAFATDKGNWRHTLRALRMADLDADFYDPEAEPTPGTPCLIYAGTERLARDEQARLRCYVEEGGTLICFSRFPRMDAFGDPCNELEIPLPDAVRPVAALLNLVCGEAMTGLDVRGHCGRVQVFDYGRLPFPVETRITALPFKTYIPVPGGDTVYRMPDAPDLRHESVTIGWVRRIGRGRLVVAGINALPAVIHLLVNALDIGWYARSSDPGIATTLHRRTGDKWVLFVRNDNAHAVHADICLETARLGISARRRYGFEDLRAETRVDKAGADLHAIRVSLPGFDVGVFEIGPHSN